MKYVPPGRPGSIVSVEPRYENFIGGKWLAPTHGKYRVDLAPATAGPITEVADSTPEDVELALDAAHTEGRLGRGVPAGEFLVGGIDVLLGDIDGCPFYIDKRLDQAWHQEQFLLDTAPGEPEDFSLAAGDNLHFVTRSPACASAERTPRTRPFLHL